MGVYKVLPDALELLWYLHLYDFSVCCSAVKLIGNGRLNYINGYISKDHDAVDVGLGEYVQKNATSSWLAAYKLLSKGSPCLPEVAIHMALPYQCIV